MAARLAVFRSRDVVRPTRLSLFSDRIEVTRRYGSVVRTRRIEYKALSSVEIVHAKGSSSVIIEDDIGSVPVPHMGPEDARRARKLIEGLRKPGSGASS
jgi:hypothetical protein